MPQQIIKPILPAITTQQSRIDPNTIQIQTTTVSTRTLTTDQINSQNAELQREIDTLNARIVTLQSKIAANTALLNIQ